MNKQRKNLTSRGIEWTDYTFNPIAGCQHGCAWTMPDGSIANCYAEDVANGVAGTAYPQGFEYHYWKPTLLKEPGKLKTPSKIFVGSMADVFGHWVPTDQIQQVLDVCRRCPQHIFQFLTKNPVRLKEFDFPANCWVGISAPPSFMFGKELTQSRQERWFTVSHKALSECRAYVKWVSFEPLSFDVTPVLRSWESLDFNWAVIGAASNGKKKFQPDCRWVEKLITELDAWGIPKFFKGNLAGDLGYGLWCEDFPESPSGA